MNAQIPIVVGTKTTEVVPHNRYIVLTTAQAKMDNFCCRYDSRP